MSNVFLPFAIIPTGASGPGPTLDLFALSPPTGLDRELTFICTGEFKGALAIEGSTDGINWDVVTQFDAGSDADGLPGPRLEFSPKLANVVVRFLRTNARGAVILAPSQVSVGAADNCVCLVCGIPNSPDDGGCSFQSGPTDRFFSAKFLAGSIAPFDLVDLAAGSSINPDPDHPATGIQLLANGPASPGGFALAYLSTRSPFFVDGSKFCFCVRMRAAVTAGGFIAYQASIQSQSTINQIAIRGFAGTPNWQLFTSAQGDGPTVDLGIPFDAVEHEFKTCIDGLNVSVLIDGLPGPPVPPLPFPLIGPFYPGLLTETFAPDTGDLRVQRFCLRSGNP